MPIHVAITRRVRPGCEAEFQEGLRDFFQTSFTHGGVLGASMLTPPPDSVSREFGILRSFAIIVGLLTWVVMPFVTRLLRGWLNPQPENKGTPP